VEAAPGARWHQLAHIIAASSSTRVAPWQRSFIVCVTQSS